MGDGPMSMTEFMHADMIATKVDIKRAINRIRNDREEQAIDELRDAIERLEEWD